MNDFHDAMKEKIETAVNEVVALNAEQVIKLAVEEFEKRLRKSIGLAVMTMCHVYEVGTCGEHLEIRVRIENSTKSS